MSNYQTTIPLLPLPSEIITNLVIPNFEQGRVCGYLDIIQLMQVNIDKNGGDTLLGLVETRDWLKNKLLEEGIDSSFITDHPWSKDIAHEQPNVGMGTCCLGEPMDHTIHRPPVESHIA